MNKATGSEKVVNGYEAPTTNNRMELSTAIADLNAVRPGAHITMIEDSQYVIWVVTEWVPKWKAKGWRAAGGKPVANAELWQTLELAAAQHETVVRTSVRGHARQNFDERIDRIAQR